jgi:hypothetical protein
MTDTGTTQWPGGCPPKPSYQGLFREPVYADGGYDDSETEEDPEGPGIITP